VPQLTESNLQERAELRSLGRSRAYANDVHSKPKTMIRLIIFPLGLSELEPFIASGGSYQAIETVKKLY